MMGQCGHANIRAYRGSWESLAGCDNANHVWKFGVFRDGHVGVQAVEIFNGKAPRSSFLDLGDDDVVCRSKSGLIFTLLEGSGDTVPRVVVGMHAVDELSGGKSRAREYSELVVEECQGRRNTAAASQRQSGHSSRCSRR